MKKIIPTLKPPDGFRRGRSAKELLTNSTWALRTATRDYTSAFGRAPTARTVRTGQAFEVVRFKTRSRLTYTDRSGTQLHLNRLLPLGWTFQVKDRRSREKINVWVKRTQLIVPVNDLRRSDALLSLLHELGHIHTIDLVEERSWQAYDRANLYYHRNRFPGYTQRQQRQISPNELLMGRYWPHDEAIRRMPDTYHAMLLDIFRTKRADEQFAWAWAALALSRMYEAGFCSEPRMTPKLVRAYIRRPLTTYERATRACTGYRLTGVWK